MGCTRDANYQNPKGTNQIIRKKKTNLFYPPNFTPIVYKLSQYSSMQGDYTVVYITGQNFYPSCIGSTVVNFNTRFTHLPVLFHSPFLLSFVVPVDADVGENKIYVVNSYNANFKGRNYSSNINDGMNYSNAISYKIEGRPEL